MSERDIIMLAVGGVVGYCLCFVVEIAKLLREEDPPQLPEPPAHHRAERDPADWWKDCQ